MYKKILVPLDGSATAESVLPYAEALAAGFKTGIELLSAIDVDALASHLATGKGNQLDSLTAAAETASRDYLERVAKSFARLPSQCRVARGKPEDVILDAAVLERETLIAMATHGRSGAKRWLLGSVAEKVLRGTTNPLFLVRADVARTMPQRIINSIVVPLDGSVLAEQILPTVSSWARALEVEVTLIRAFEFPTAAYSGGAEAFADFNAFRDEARKDVAAYLHAIADSLVQGGVRTVSTFTMEGAAADEIISYGQGAPRAMIAMSTHGRSGLRRWLLGSVTEKVVRHGDDPVLVIRGE
jgi:nucleotide-binding universal stress UspA family protein